MVLSMEKWHDKVCIVTGASDGIGACLALGLVRHGLIVVGLARRVEKIDALKRELADHEQQRLFAVKCDLTLESDILRAFQEVHTRFGLIHVLINNAALAVSEPLAQGHTADWRAMLETNVLGLTIATREALRDMQRHGEPAHVIHINSILGHYVAFVPNINMYSATKHAVTALTEALRQELLVDGNKIRVTSVSPGPVETKMFTQDVATAKMNFPMLKVDDVLDAVVYVLSTPDHVQVQDVLLRPLGEPV